MEELFADIGGYRLHYYAHGSGTPVLLLHGWGCDGTFLFRAAEALEGLCRCYIPDLPGHGQSPALGDYGIEDYAELVLRFMDVLGLPKAGLVAHSFGGRIALLLASGHPDRIGNVVITGGAGLIKKRTVKYHLKVRFFKLGKKLTQPKWVRKLLKAVGIDVEKKLAQAGSADYRALSEEMKKVFVRVVNTDLRPCLARITAPTLLVWGREDTETPLYFGETMEKEIADAALVVFDGCGHYAFLEQHARFGAILRSFFGGK